MKIFKKIKKFFVLRAHPLSRQEMEIANYGERLVPKSVIDPELVRHKSSYFFFKKIISLDSKAKNKKIKIVDLGCGVGHGCYSLSKIKNSEVLGIDNSHKAIEYAKKKYKKSNIKYEVGDILEFIKKMPEYDYVVSRGVLEHIRGGLSAALKSKWRLRLIFDVPYKEDAGPNPHHLITEITEKSFSKFPNKELFYEDIDGNIFNEEKKPKRPNMILCVSSSRSVKPLSDYKIKFPIPAWQGKKLDQ